MEVKEFAPGEWHEYRILVEGNRLRHWIDGHPTGDLLDLDAIGLSPDTELVAHDEVTGETFPWGAATYVRLDPARAPAHILHVTPR